MRKSLKKENEELKAVLMPFANLLQAHMAYNADSMPIIAINGIHLTTAHLRRAFRAIHGDKPFPKTN